MKKIVTVPEQAAPLLAPPCGDSRKDFDVEFVVRGRISFDPAKLNEVPTGFSDPEEGKEWAASPYGVSLQTAVLEALLADQELLTGLVIDKAAFLASQCLEEGGSAPILGRMSEEEFLWRLMEALPSPQGKIIREMIAEKADVDANLPVLYESGCIKVSAPFRVVIASICNTK